MWYILEEAAHGLTSVIHCFSLRTEVLSLHHYICLNLGRVAQEILNGSVRIVWSSGYLLNKKELISLSHRAKKAFHNSHTTLKLIHRTTLFKCFEIQGEGQALKVQKPKAAVALVLAVNHTVSTSQCIRCFNGYFFPLLNGNVIDLLNLTLYRRKLETSEK